jgi:2-oxoisovalerate dehydrogenase E1 component
MFYDRKDLSNDTLLTIYKRLLYPRLIEEKMLLLLRQGKISKWFSGIGTGSNFRRHMFCPRAR